MTWIRRRTSDYTHIWVYACGAFEIYETITGKYLACGPKGWNYGTYKTLEAAKAACEEAMR